jgi:hypothetical protein
LANVSGGVFGRLAGGDKRCNVSVSTLPGSMALLAVSFTISVKLLIYNVFEIQFKFFGGK